MLTRNVQYEHPGNTEEKKLFEQGRPPDVG